jgi:tRNA(Ile)-lysidine synthase
MADLEKRVLKTIRDHQLLDGVRSLVAAVSGGPDSVCLLHCAKRLLPEITISAVYVDHQLRPAESPAEIELVSEHCRLLDVDFKVCTVDVPADVIRTRDSLEASARRLRHQALEQERRRLGADRIGLGHNGDDQAEEVLLRLIRGSGLKGLSGMSPRNGRLIRPLIDVSKDEILSWLESRDLMFCTDSSNRSRRFLRNRIRLELLPLLESGFNPSIRKTLRRTAALLRLEEDYLKRQTDHLYDQIFPPAPSSTNDDATFPESITLPTALLADQHPALRRRIIERLCWEMGSRPDGGAITRIDDLFNSVTGAEIHLVKRLRVVRQPDSLLFARLGEHRGPRERLAEPAGVDISIPGPGEYRCGDDGLVVSIVVADKRVEPQAGLMLVDADLVDFPLRLCPASPGDRFKPLGGPGSRKVSRFLNDRKIPAHRRRRYPVIKYGDTIVGVLGLAVDDRFRISDTTRRSLVIAVR